MQLQPKAKAALKAAYGARVQGTKKFPAPYPQEQRDTRWTCDKQLEQYLVAESSRIPIYWGDSRNLVGTRPGVVQMSMQRDKPPPEPANDFLRLSAVSNASVKRLPNRHQLELIRDPDCIGNRRCILTELVKLSMHRQQSARNDRRIMRLVVVQFKEQARVIAIHAISSASKPFAEYSSQIHCNPPCTGLAIHGVLCCLPLGDMQSDNYRSKSSNSRPSIPIDHATSAQPPALADAIEPSELHGGYAKASNQEFAAKQNDVGRQPLSAHQLTPQYVNPQRLCHADQKRDIPPMERLSRRPLFQLYSAVPAA